MSRLWACRVRGFGSDFTMNALDGAHQRELNMLFSSTIEGDMREIHADDEYAGGGPYQIASWPAEDLKAHIAFMMRFGNKLSAAGELAGAEGLSGPDQAKLVPAGANGEPVTDGVFPESKEFLAGYWIVDVDTPERAYAIAAEASAAPGPGGKPLNMPIEVRQVMTGSAGRLDAVILSAGHLCSRTCCAISRRRF